MTYRSFPPSSYALPPPPPLAPPPCSRNELLGEIEIDLLEEVQSAPGGDITKTWELENVATEWMQWGGGELILSERLLRCRV